MTNDKNKAATAAADSSSSQQPVTTAIAIFSEGSEPTVLSITPFLAALAVLRARRIRAANPAGYFKGKKFYPDAAEMKLVPDNVRSPSNEFPYTMLKYCRTPQHVSNLFQVDAKQLSDAYRACFGKKRAADDAPEVSDDPTTES